MLGLVIRHGTPLATCRWLAAKGSLPAYADWPETTALDRVRKEQP